MSSPASHSTGPSRSRRSPGLLTGRSLTRDLDGPRGDDAAAALAALRRIVRSLRLGAARSEAETRLTAAQHFVLEQVAATPGLSLTEVAAQTLTDRTSVAAVVERLEEKGLVRTSRPSADRRRVEVRATAAGRATLARAPHPPTRLVLDGMTALGDRDLHALAMGLARLTEAMGLGDGPAPLLFAEGLGGAAAGARGRAPREGRPAARGRGRRASG